MKVVEVAVGAIVLRGDALLLVQRGRGVAVGRWSIPGGRIEFGESVEAAVAREVREETGLQVRVDRFAGWVEQWGSDPVPHHYVILDFFATEIDPDATAHAGDDATALRWVPVADLDTIDLVEGLAEFLASAGVCDGRGR